MVSTVDDPLYDAAGALLSVAVLPLLVMVVGVPVVPLNDAAKTLLSGSVDPLLVMFWAAPVAPLRDVTL
jgi:hypothetical protein